LSSAIKTFFYASDILSDAIKTFFYAIRKSNISINFPY